MRSINSRKGQSITHLMNFSLPPPPLFGHSQSQNHRYARRNPTWGLGSGYHAIDKARYVHANYRFIVRPDRTYRAQAVDADVHLEWDAVLQILASAETQLASCPICLSEVPVAPRMAKCGHICCLPCLIRYMHSTDDTNPIPEKRARWKKCPICEDSIYISETRPVRWFSGQEASMLQDGVDVLLKLLMREPGSTLALPRDAAEGYRHAEDIPWYHIAEVLDYARFMKGSGEYMGSQYEDEIKVLQAQEKEDELMFGDDSTWTKKAVAAILDAKEKLKILEGSATPSIEKKTRHEPIIFRGPPEGVPQMYTAKRASNQILVAHGEGSMSTSLSRVPPVTSHDPHTEVEKHLSGFLAKLELHGSRQHSNDQSDEGVFKSKHSTTRPEGHPFFFYNALPNFFLSPLDIRILGAAFGSFSSFPSSLLPRIEHISTGHTVDDDLRKRAKYLAHLPYGCEVSFLECDWTDVINPSVLARFREDIGRRRRRNHEKKTREEKERIRAEKEEEDKRWAAVRRRRPSVSGKSFSESDFQAIAHADTGLVPEPQDAVGFSTSPPWGANRTHSSFATLATPGTSPDAPRTVWGTAAVQPSSPTIPVAPVEHSLPDDGWAQGWEQDLLDQEDTLTIGAFQGAASSTGKKKKNKKITLLLTNARRGA